MAEKFIPLDERIYAYMLAHQAPEHSMLQAIRKYTETLSEARMLTTPEQGQFPGFLVRLTGTQRVLELGTYTGYSALVFALALPPGGSVLTCDVDQKCTRVAQGFWEQAGVASKINLRLAPAADTLSQLERGSPPQSFDLIFIDADKPGYDDYYECALRLVKPPGLIIPDNTLRRGRVANPKEADTDTVALRLLNKKIACDERVDRVLLPIGTGMTFARLR